MRKVERLGEVGFFSGQSAFDFGAFDDLRLDLPRCLNIRFDFFVHLISQSQEVSFSIDDDAVLKRGEIGGMETLNGIGDGGGDGVYLVEHVLVG